MKDDRMDGSRFKSFCEGKMNTTRLYTENSHKGSHNSKLITTSNTIPNFIVDSGMIRRIDAYEQKAKFVDDATKVNESMGIFLKDIKLKKKIQSSIEHKCAWVDILAKHAQKYLVSYTIEKTVNFSLKAVCIASFPILSLDLFVIVNVESIKSCILSFDETIKSFDTWKFTVFSIV